MDDGVIPDLASPLHQVASCSCSLGPWTHPEDQISHPDNYEDTHGADQFTSWCRISLLVSDARLAERAHKDPARVGPSRIPRPRLTLALLACLYTEERKEQGSY
ncbi:hypothetical protein DPEC_G00075670 [Dallia pectoralis]|uniref:Uncharacterized protein n=1 Tax=Dallia pectoralis TaxID=75939 RepID=A0ACC2H3D5_DALPE|nr:hypothetical protein DPEC_G00075670 [Dallia pectoralis]